MRREVVLADEALPRVDAPRLDPAFHRQAAQGQCGGQALLDMHIGARMNGLHPRRRGREAMQHHVVAAPFHIAAQPADGKLAGPITADVQAQQLPGRHALVVGIAVDAGKMKRLVRGNGAHSEVKPEALTTGPSA